MSSSFPVKGECGYDAVLGTGIAGDAEVVSCPDHIAEDDSSFLRGEAVEIYFDIDLRIP